MFEMLVGAGGSNQIIMNDSGPGPKLIKVGDKDLGYFGEVTGLQLFTLSEVAAVGPLTAGNDNPNMVSTTAMWLKFIWRNKVIYIAKQQFRNSISWNDIYNAGMMYGTRDNGRYPTTTPKHQYNQMIKMEGTKRWVLKPRLITGYAADPVTGAMVGTLLGEFNQLLGRCVNDSNGNIGGLKFDNFNYAQVGWPSSVPDSITQETMQNPTDSMYVRGDGASGSIFAASRGVSKAATVSGVLGHGWRPVIELIPDSDAKDPHQVNGTTPGRVAGAINAVYGFVGESAPLNPRKANWPYKFMPVSFSFVNDPIRVTAVKGTSDYPDLQGFSITGSYVD